MYFDGLSTTMRTIYTPAKLDIARRALLYAASAEVSGEDCRFFRYWQWRYYSDALLDKPAGEDGLSMGEAVASTV